MQCLFIRFECMQNLNLSLKIVAAFRGMHVSPAKHSYGSVTDGQTDRQTTDKVIPMCRYASQATQKGSAFMYVHVFALERKLGHSSRTLDGI